MKVRIDAEERDRLVIGLRNYGGILIVPIAALLVAAAGIVLWVLGNSYSLSVSDGEVRYDRSFLARAEPEMFRARTDEITGVEVVLDTTLGFINSYEVEISTARESVLARFPFLEGPEKREMADALRQAIAQMDGQVDYEEDSTGVAYILAGACLIGAILLLRALQTVTIRGDRRRARLVIRRRRTFWPSGSKSVIPLAGIAGVEIDTITMPTPRGLVNTSFALWIRRVDARGGSDRVPVALGPVFTAQSAEETKAALDRWLDVSCF